MTSFFLSLKPAVLENFVSIFIQLFLLGLQLHLTIFDSDLEVSWNMAANQTIAFPIGFPMGTSIAGSQALDSSEQVLKLDDQVLGCEAVLGVGKPSAGHLLSLFVLIALNEDTWQYMTIYDNIWQYYIHLDYRRLECILSTWLAWTPWVLANKPQIQREGLCGLYTISAVERYGYKPSQCFFPSWNADLLWLCTQNHPVPQLDSCNTNFKQLHQGLPG